MLPTRVAVEPSGDLGLSDIGYAGTHVHLPGLAADGPAVASWWRRPAAF